MNRLKDDFVQISLQYEGETSLTHNDKYFDILCGDLSKLDYIADEFRAISREVKIEDYEDGDGSKAEVCVEICFGYLVFDFLQSSHSRDYLFRALRNIRILGFSSTNDKEYFCMLASFPSIWAIK